VFFLVFLWVVVVVVFVAAQLSPALTHYSFFSSVSIRLREKKTFHDEMMLAKEEKFMSTSKDCVCGLTFLQLAPFGKSQTTKLFVEI
jgi:hypothetical protein